MAVKSIVGVDEKSKCFGRVNWVELFAFLLDEYTQKRRINLLCNFLSEKNPEKEKERERSNHINGYQWFIMMLSMKNKW